MSLLKCWMSCCYCHCYHCIWECLVALMIHLLSLFQHHHLTVQLVKEIRKQVVVFKVNSMCLKNYDTNCFGSLDTLQVQPGCQRFFFWGGGGGGEKWKNTGTQGTVSIINNSKPSKCVCKKNSSILATQKLLCPLYTRSRIWEQVRAKRMQYANGTQKKKYR